MLNDAQNIKLLSKLRRAMEVFEPYIFTKVAQLPFVMYETAERLEKIPETSLFAPPAQRPSRFDAVHTAGGAGWAAPVSVPGAGRLRSHALGGWAALWNLCNENRRHKTRQPLLRPHLRRRHTGKAH